MNTTTIGTLFAFLAIISSVMAYAPAYGAHSDDPVVEIPDGVGLCTEDGAECYSPETITVNEGTTVTWNNNDSTTPIHTITSGAITDNEVGLMFNSEFVKTGAMFEYTFDEAGEYNYFCQLHPRMSGLVIVEEAHGEETDMMDNGKDTDMMDKGDMDMMDKDPEMMDDRYTMMDANTMTLDNNIMVKVAAMSNPVAGSPLELQLKFTDNDGNNLDHVNYDIIVIQGNTRVASETGMHNHDGQDTIETRALASDEAVDVRVTFQGLGLPNTAIAERTGPIGEMVEFKDVPEFGTIVMVVLIVAIVSIVAATTRSSIFQRI